MGLKQFKVNEGSYRPDELHFCALRDDQTVLRETAATSRRPRAVAKAGIVRLVVDSRQPQHTLASGETLRSITFMLAIAAFGASLAPNAVSAQTRPPAPIAAEQPTARDVPGRTSSEKAVDELDRQLGKKLNICRGC